MLTISIFYTVFHKTLSRTLVDDGSKEPLAANFPPCILFFHIKHTLTISTASHFCCLLHLFRLVENLGSFSQTGPSCPRSNRATPAEKQPLHTRCLNPPTTRSSTRTESNSVSALSYMHTAVKEWTNVSSPDIIM